MDIKEKDAVENHDWLNLEGTWHLKRMRIYKNV